ncbi:mitochondrial tRNA-specific 2-thiouridylase 1 isoform X2 [Centruroides vittatus]|uniref:mitochondrial tRNA-specific 2-thiouridylase 1 isoform X2 n=1 Tax=Centruroides vittatus TaxID=120091 RepID=UPI003510CC1E
MHRNSIIIIHAGYEVIGVFMRNWDVIDETGQCLADKDSEDARYVCRVVGIPFREVNFVKQYWNGVFSEMIDEYKKGITPNPDVLCNKRIKFGIFWNYMINQLKVDAIATGHYAQTSFGEDLENYDPHKGARLLRAVDDFRDQTLFLSQIPQEALQKSLFPVGRLMRNDVQKIASEIPLTKILKKKKSTGICFIGKRNFQKFINDYIEPSVGNFIDVETGSIVGQHSGIHQWTLGQRCLLPGCKVAYFVAEKNPASQDILVAPGSDHPSLYCDTVIVENPYWINRVPEDLLRTKKLKCKIRTQQGYRYPLEKCQVDIIEDDKLFVKIENSQRALTPGQYAVLYLDEECLGSGRIAQLGPSLYDLQMNKNTELGFISTK